jgi:hypothetical protein
VRRTIWRGVTDLPKGGRARTVDLPASAVDMLKAHRHLRGRYVFCQEDGQPLAEGKMKQPLRRALNRAGISREEGRIGWHDLRHTYASHLAMRGVPLKVIQELMGRVTIEMTERYAHLSPDTRREAVGVLDRSLPLAPACDIRATRMEGATNRRLRWLLLPWFLSGSSSRPEGSALRTPEVGWRQRAEGPPHAGEHPWGRRRTRSKWTRSSCRWGCEWDPGA